MAKIDLKDLKILYELSKDCRQSLSQISKKVGLKREVVDYRIRKLVRTNIITNFITDIDETKLGYQRHLVYFAFQNVKDEDEIINYIIKHPFVAYVTTSTGKWSVILDYIAKDLTHVNKFIDEIKTTFPNKIADYFVTSLIEFKHFNSKFYNIKGKSTQKTIKHTKHKIDKTDLKLLKILSNNARAGYVDLSKELKLSPNGIKNRINTLVNSKVIKSFSMNPNKFNLGYELYYIQLDLVNETKQQEKDLINFIKKHPRMNAYYRPLGQGIEIIVFVENSTELRNIVLDLRNKFSKVIKIRDTMLYYAEDKGNYLPAGVFDNF